MHGLGNDFIIFDNINDPVIHEAEFIQKISHRRLGIGCDQIMIIENTKKKKNVRVKTTSTVSKFV